MTRIDDPVMDRLRAADPLPLDDLARLMREGAAPDLSPPAAGPARRRRVLWGAATAAAVAGVAGVLVVSLPRGEERPAVPGHIGILDRPATEADRLPEWVRGEQMILEEGVDRDGARLAKDAGDHRYYIAPAAGGARICLIDIPVPAPVLPAPSLGFSGGPGRSVGGIQCTGTAVFERRFMIVMTEFGAGGRDAELVGIVPDGHDTAEMAGTRTEVRNNLFVLRPSRLGDAVRVSGGDGERTAYHGFSVRPFTSRIPRDIDLTVSVFRRGPTLADRLPAVLREALDRARRTPGGPDPQPGTARRVAQAGKTTYWLIMDRFERRRPRALLATVTGTGAVVRPIVLPTRAEPFRAAASTVVREPYGPTRITLRTVVPDGFNVAVVGGRTVPIRNNFLLAQDVPVYGQYRVELRGPAGRMLQTSSVGPEGFRSHFPTNQVPHRLDTYVRARAAVSGLRPPYAATIVAGRSEDLARVLGPWAAIGTSDVRRTVPVVTVRSGRVALVLLVESAAAPGAIFRERRYRTDRLPDLGALGRVRPLELP